MSRKTRFKEDALTMTDIFEREFLNGEVLVLFC